MAGGNRTNDPDTQRVSDYYNTLPWHEQKAWCELMEHSAIASCRSKEAEQITWDMRPPRVGKRLRQTLAFPRTSESKPSALKLVSDGAAWKADTLGH